MRESVPLKPGNEFDAVAARETSLNSVLFRRCLQALRSQIPLIWEQEIQRRRSAAQSWEKGSFGGGLELVTEADVASSLQLLELVRGAYPFSISEEHLSNFGANADIWIFDPLDGTACFADPNFLSTYWNKVEALVGERSSVWKHLSLADVQSDRLSMGETLLAAFFTQENSRLIPLSGIVYSPGSKDADHIMWSCDESGLTRNQEVVLLGREGERSSILRVGLTPYLESQTGEMKLTEYLLEVFEGYFVHKARDKDISSIQLVPFGGSGDGISRLLAGEIDIVLHPYRCCKVWDVAPGIPLLRQVGGSVSDFWGREIRSFSAESIETDPRQKSGVVLSSAPLYSSFVDYITLSSASLFRDLGFID